MRTSNLIRTGAVLLPILIFFCGNLKADDEIRKSWLDEWQYLSNQLKQPRPDAAVRKRLEQETFQSAALLFETDRNPLDVVLRRTAALLDDLELENKQALQKELNVLGDKNDQLAQNDPKRRDLFLSACKLRRRIAFSNPLLDFNKIVFLTHHRARFEHMVDQYYGFHAPPGGSVYVLNDPFGEKPVAQNLMDGALVQNGRLKGRKLTAGSFISLDLNYNADEIAFAWTEAEVPVQPTPRTPQEDLWNERSTYHVFKMKIDGSDLTQLSDGKWNDFDPCYLPGGRIAFISDRRGGFLRCGTRPNPVYTLHSMKENGADIQRLSHHETHEWHPSVDHNGMIVYTRWDYVDRDSDSAHHLWLTYPDGRDPRALHGNYAIKRESRPWMELSLRAIPGSQKYSGISAPHHGQAYGSLIMIDLAVPDNKAMSQVKRLTPDIFLPEAETAPGIPRKPKEKFMPGSEQIGSPWPLSENYYLCTYDRKGRDYGIYLIDSFGNRELVYRDPSVPCLDPIPLRARKQPPALPGKTTQNGKKRGEVAVMDVYQSEQDWPENTDIAALRVIQLFPKTTPASAEPNIGFGTQSLGRGVLGTVPVEKDGSAYFEAPSGVPLYFQALDQKGRAIQSMRSATYLHEGERLSCVGCHESKSRTASYRNTKNPIAFQRAPSKIKPDVEGSFPLTFPRLVQHVINKNCTSCHDGKNQTFSLKGDTFEKYGWSTAYKNLTPFAWTRYGGNGPGLERNKTSYSVPGEVGARASRLLQLLEDGHYEVKLSDEELHHITLWLDCSSLFYGVYHDTEKQALGKKVMPILE
ncbi:MAG: hypothetical protein QM496_13080 [Verrucomicrobiota bacterium]